MYNDLSCLRLPDGLTRRGDINLLMLGDPGTAKSQLLKFVERCSPIGVRMGLMNIYMCVYIPRLIEKNIYFRAIMTLPQHRFKPELQRWIPEVSFADN